MKKEIVALLRMPLFVLLLIIGGGFMFAVDFFADLMSWATPKIVKFRDEIWESPEARDTTYGGD